MAGWQCLSLAGKRVSIFEPDSLPHSILRSERTRGIFERLA